MTYDPREIVETIHMTEVEHLDIRTVTMGISLRDCSTPDPSQLLENIKTKLLKTAEHHVATVEKISSEFGIPIANKRIAVTPISIVADGHSKETFVNVAKTLDECAEKIGIDYLGGYSALVQKGMPSGDKNLIESNYFNDNGNYGVNVSTSSAGYNIIKNNHYDGNTAGPIYDGGSNTILNTIFIHRNNTKF